MEVQSTEKSAKYVLKALLPRPGRFRQVQENLRRNREGGLPSFLYGKAEILTTERWKKVIEKYNPGDLLESMDKLEGKARLSGANVPVPETYLVMETEEDLLKFSSWLDRWEGGFALKPASGHGGAGIVVIDRKVSGSFIRSSGRLMDRTKLVEHASRILKGTYSGLPADRAYAEERIHLSRTLREIDTPGLLDIRIVALRGFPLMAMTRLPTERSGGKANIHQGAIGAGISISEGKIISATHLRRTTKRHPGSGRSLVGFRFNLWDTMLETASLAADASGLGYVGIDMTLDDRKGVLVIEVNKRPGLEIQNANGAGLLKRIRWVERQIRKLKLDPGQMGPGIKAELSRGWDRSGWERERKKGEGEEE